MPHVLIVGTTESGKTTLAKRLVYRYRQRHTKCVVLDPLNDPGWHADYQTTDPNAFLDVVKRSRSCAVFVDESGEVIGRYNDEMRWLATRARHYGHNSHFLTQRIAQLDKTVRDQCSVLFLFAVSRDDAKTLANEWNNEQLLRANMLPQGSCFYVTRFGNIRKVAIFT